MRPDPKGRIAAEVGHGLGRAVQSGSASTRGAVGVHVDGSVSREDGRLAGTTTVSLRPGIPDSVRDNEVGR